SGLPEPLCTFHGFVMPTNVQIGYISWRDARLSALFSSRASFLVGLPASERPALGQIMKLVRFFQTAVKHLSPRARRVWVGTTRAQIEYRDINSEELEDFRHQLELAA